MHAKLFVVLAMVALCLWLGREARASAIQQAGRVRAVALDPRDRQRALHCWHLD